MTPQADWAMPVPDAAPVASRNPEPCLETQIDDTPLRLDQEATPPTSRAKPKPWERNFSPVVEAAPQTPTSQPVAAASAPPDTEDIKESKLKGTNDGDVSGAQHQQQLQQHQKQQQEQALDVAQALGMGMDTPLSAAPHPPNLQNGSHQPLPAKASSLASLLSGDIGADATPRVTTEAASAAPKPTLNPLDDAGAGTGLGALSAAERMDMLGDADEGEEQR